MHCEYQDEIIESIKISVLNIILILFKPYKHRSYYYDKQFDRDFKKGDSIIHLKYF